MWQDISTAPKDGTEILVAIGEKRRVVSWYTGINRINRRFPWLCQSGTDGWRADVPTHWQPLPQPPVIPATPQTDHGGQNG
jgi:hypothetical protein